MVESLRGGGSVRGPWPTPGIIIYITYYIHVLRVLHVVTYTYYYKGIITIISTTNIEKKYLTLTNKNEEKRGPRLWH